MADRMFDGLGNTSGPGSQAFAVKNMTPFAAQHNSRIRSLQPPKCDAKCQQNHQNKLQYFEKKRSGEHQSQQSAPLGTNKTSSQSETTANWDLQSGQVTEPNSPYSPDPLSGTHQVYYQDALNPSSAVTTQGTDQDGLVGPDFGLKGVSGTDQVGSGSSTGVSASYNFPQSSPPPGISSTALRPPSLAPGDLSDPGSDPYPSLGFSPSSKFFK